jgi:nicotinamidase-related amidase
MRVSSNDYRLATDVVGDSVRAFRLDAPRAALVVVDMQYASAHRATGLGRWLDVLGVPPEQAAYRFDRIEQVALPACCRLLEAFRARRATVIHIRLGSSVPECGDLSPALRDVEHVIGNYVGRHEYDGLEELAPVAGEPVVTKLSVSAFTSSNLDQLLRNLGIAQLVVCGVSTSHCVDLTARDAADRGYEVLIAEDACVDDRPQLHTMSLTLFAQLFGRVAGSAEVIEELDSSIHVQGVPNA